MTPDPHPTPLGALFFGLVHDTRQKGPTNLPQVEMRHRLVAEPKQFDGEAVFAVLRVLLDQVVVF
jgi:hypothetical protein